jgi:putative oxidoreductase
MTTATTPAFSDLSVDRESAARYLAPIGRTLFAGIFVMAGLGNFSPQTIAFAAQSGVPLANIAVPVSGVMAIAGGLSVVLGFHARIGAVLIALFLIPVTFSMHAFWAVSDPMMQQIQQAHFFKNISMLGAALLILRTGAGPVSLDARRG